ncbi:MAG: GNAT family N-acetyltransferase [Mycobacteriaceae bacterium]
MNSPANPIIRRAWAADLDTATLYSLLRLRVEVFVVERSSAYHELDGLDLAEGARHIWMEHEGQVICTVRLNESRTANGPELRLSRLCTTPEFRGQGHTKRVLQAALAEVGSRPCLVDAYANMVDLYAEHGFVPDGSETTKEGVARVPLRRNGTLTSW